MDTPIDMLICNAGYHGGCNERQLIDGNYSDSLAYGHSKLANVLFSLQLSELRRGMRISSNSLHPGVIHGHNHVYDAPMAARLMQISEQLTSAYLVPGHDRHYE